MIKWSLIRETGSPLRVLCLGAHSDDIEIGCGGTVLTLIQENADIAVDWVVFSGDPVRKREAQASANSFLDNAKHRRVLVRNFRDGFFPYVGGRIKEFFERLKREASPHVIFTHYRHDLHQDHRVICELTWNTFRDHLILEYEIPKFDGDIGAPNFFVHLDESTCQHKIDALLQHFGSQRDNHWFSKDLFFSLLRLRGVESNAPSGFAEAFYSRKMVM
jgi:LmbE family N-acetylglucosaminyl deacetylase